MWPFRKRPPVPLPVRRARFSWRVSILLHLLVLGYFFGQFLSQVAIPVPMEPAGREGELEVASLPDDNPPLIELGDWQPSPKPWLATQAVDTRQVEQALSDPRWSELVQGELEQKSLEERAAAGGFLTDRVMRSISRAEQHNSGENLERLENLTEQLNQISTKESVAEMTAQVSKFLGTGPRATAPAKEPVAGEFDFDTGQLHDVRREELPGGGFKYTAVLIDSAGRTFDTDLDAEVGESAYKTFELIKQNPLLERVYRGVVMSLLDNVIKPKN